MKIMMVAGGTGGHIYPALALAEELEKRGHDITFVGSNDRMEKDVVPAHNFKYIGLNVYSTSGNVFNKLKSIVSIFFAYFKSKKILEGFDLAIGFGNYISIPIMNAAFKLGLKTIIHEQNSYVGRANRMLDKKVDLVIGSYEENINQFKNPNTKILGNPQSSKAYKIRKDKKVIENIGLDSNKKTVCIFMGSLGSSSVNEKLLDYFKLVDGTYQIVYATGKTHYDKVISNVERKDYIRIFERIDGINVMKNSDLLICRAGATTISEIEAIGVASILIPSPYVPNNHQYHNGMALVNKGAAIMIEEKDLSGEMLKEYVDSLINDELRLNDLRTNALKLGNPSVMNDIINEVESI